MTAIVAQFKKAAKPAAFAAALGALLLTTACFSFKFVTVDEQTALEAQILGSFSEVEKELILIASVRAGKDDAKAKISAEEKEALRAAMNRRFNADDIEELKDEQCLSEKLDGMIEAVACDAAKKDDKVSKLLAKLVDEENADRMTIIKRVVKKSPELTDADLPKVAAVFAKINFDRAKPHHLITDKTGARVMKKDYKN